MANRADLIHLTGFASALRHRTYLLSAGSAGQRYRPDPMRA